MNSSWYPNLETLFKSLADEFPELGSDWLSHLRQGYTPTALAQEMAIRLREKEREAQAKLSACQETFEDFKRNVEPQERQLRAQLDSKIQAELAQEEKIIRLNRIIAQQQKQLNNLLGNND